MVQRMSVPELYTSPAATTVAAGCLQQYPKLCCCGSRCNLIGVKNGMQWGPRRSPPPGPASTNAGP
eukprot:8530795-Alexandrium_andersonii.AAC.1